jgi:hypothetical protein
VLSEQGRGGPDNGLADGVGKLLPGQAPGEAGREDLLGDLISSHAPIIVRRAPRRSVVTDQSAMAAAVEPWLSHLRWGELEGGRRLNGGGDFISARG